MKPLRITQRVFWKSVSLGLGATILLGSGITAIAPATAIPLQVSQRQEDWNTVLRVARLVNARQQVTDLVLQLDILDKPETSYANAVYQVFARIDGEWQEIYTNIGARLIPGQSGRIILEPEVISIQALQERLEVDLSEVDLRVVTQLRYDSRGGRRDQRIEIEQVQAYSLISEITTLEIESGLIGIPCPLDCEEIDDDDFDVVDDSDDDNEVVYEDVVTLSNGYRVTFLGVTYAGSTSTWRYYVEELPVAQDLSNWVLELPTCARVVDASPRGELVNPDPNARLSGIKWQPGGGFVEGEFSVTLSGSLTVGEIQVAVKGPDVAIGDLAGPACN